MHLLNNPLDLYINMRMEFMEKADGDMNITLLHNRNN